MAKPELGTKRVCPSCGTKYYDLMRSPIVCPNCGTIYELSAREKALSARSVEDEEEEEIEEEERELIHSIFEFGDTLVREVMVPRTDMVVIRSDAVLRDALETTTKAGYSRIPIYEGDTDNIVGVLYAKDLLKRSPSRDG